MGPKNDSDVLEHVNKQVLRLVVGVWKCLGVICSGIIGTEPYIFVLLDR